MVSKASGHDAEVAVTSFVRRRESRRRIAFKVFRNDPLQLALARAGDQSHLPCNSQPAHKRPGRCLQQTSLRRADRDRFRSTNRRAFRLARVAVQARRHIHASIGRLSRFTRSMNATQSADRRRLKPTPNNPSMISPGSSDSRPSSFGSSEAGSVTSSRSTRLCRRCPRALRASSPLCPIPARIRIRSRAG